LNKKHLKIYLDSYCAKYFQKLLDILRKNNYHDEFEYYEYNSLDDEGFLFIDKSDDYPEDSDSSDYDSSDYDRAYDSSDSRE